MDQSDFNRDMGNYLRNKRGKDESIFSRLKKSMPKVEVVQEDTPTPNDIPVEQVQAVMRGEKVTPPTVEVDSFDEDDVEEYKPRPFAWTKLFSWFTFSQDEEEEMDNVDLEVPLVENKPKVDEDVKDMLRICVKWVNRLPPNDIQDIRRSDEYVKFKQLLERYGLIKK